MRQASLSDDWEQLFEKCERLVCRHPISARLCAGPVDILSLSPTASLRSEHRPPFTNEETAQRACILPKATLLANCGTKVQNKRVDSEAGCFPLPQAVTMEKTRGPASNAETCLLCKGERGLRPGPGAGARGVSALFPGLVPTPGDPSPRAPLEKSPCPHCNPLKAGQRNEEIGNKIDVRWEFRSEVFGSDSQMCHFTVFLLSLPSYLSNRHRYWKCT